MPGRRSLTAGSSGGMKANTERTFVAVGVAAVGLAAAAFAAAHPLFATDAACRYAPMAEAFASADWAEAFHPRFGVGFSVLAGALRMFSGLDGYGACAAVATFAWALCALPVYSIAHRLFGRGAAWFALVLYMVCPQPLVWGLKGLREPFKMLGFLMMADAVLDCRETHSRRSAAKACLALWFLFTFKCDAICVGVAMAALFAVFDGFRWNTLAVAASGVLALQPMCALVYFWTGYWLPAPHFVPIWQRLFGA